MGIKEKDLQTVESLSTGDKVRIVTSEGNSRNVDAGAIGGGGALKVTASLVWSDSTGEYVSGTLDKTYREIENADSIMIGYEQRTYYITLDLAVYGFDDEYGAMVVVNMHDYPRTGDLLEMEFTASTKDDVLTWSAAQ